jgi:hypothetical protein
MALTLAAEDGKAAAEAFKEEANTAFKGVKGTRTCPIKAERDTFLL